MFVDHTRQIEKYLTNTGMDFAKTQSAEMLPSAQGVFRFGKMHETYRMTDNGSFFMPDAVYQKPECKEEETVVEQLDTQMDMSAANRKNQMIIITNTASAEDLAEMEKDGFSSLDMDSHTILTVTDKIKAVLAKAGVDISIYGDSLSVEELEAATGSKAAANKIANAMKQSAVQASQTNIQQSTVQAPQVNIDKNNFQKPQMYAGGETVEYKTTGDMKQGVGSDVVKIMETALKQADLPASEANIEEGAKAYEAAEELLPLSDASKEYMLKNQWEPTIKNLYMASHSGVATRGQKIDFSGLEKQIEKVIRDAGLEVTEETKESCKWLIEKNIGLTTSHLKFLVGLNQLSADLSKGGTQPLDMQQVLGRIVESIRDGKRPMDAMLIDGFTYADRAQEAVHTVMNAEDCDIAYCVEQNLPVSVENLQIAINNRGKEAEPVRPEMSQNVSFITAKRQLEETRLIMTTEANYALLKRGISIDTKPLEQVVENLKNLENQYAKDLMTQSGITPTEENISIFTTTTKYVEELKYQPAYALTLHSADETLTNVHQVGSHLKSTMDAALQSYEVMWTAPRSDMGDSIQKAFGNISEILKDLNLEDSQMNQRAVRILAYNQTEINPENITEIKDVDMEMQKLFRNLTPAATLELIRRGENPLDMEIGELNQMVENIQAETGEQEQERFSKFLWKLEQNQKISEKERESYIGIYRLIAQVEKNDGAALGALLNQGADITMRNLLTATRSAKKNMNYTVDDTFDGVKGKVKGPRIDDQIMASFQTNCLKEAGAILSPEKLAEIKEWENMTPEQILENLMKQADAEESIAAEQQYHSQLVQEYTSVLEASDDVYAFLEKYDMKNSAKNVLAVSRLLDNPNNVFDMLFGTEGKSQDYQERIADLKNQVMQNFGEAVKTPEEMANAQATLAEVAEKVMQTMIIENETISVKDLRDLRLMNQQFFLCKEKAKQESYLVPVTTGDTVTGVNLKIVRGKADKGLVDIFFRGALMEKVAASFEAKENGISGVIATTDEQTRKLFADHLDELMSRMNLDGKESVDIRVAYVENLSAWQFEKKTLSETGEETPVQTKRLYGIAESFIQTVSDIM